MMKLDTFYRGTKKGGNTCVGDYVIYYDAASLDRQIIRQFIFDPRQTFLAGEHIRSAWQNVDVEKAIVRIDDHPFFVKCYHCLGPIYRIKNFFRKSKALKAWHNGMRFQEAGISTPDPIVCLEHRRFKLLGDAYLVCEYLPDAHNLLEIWPELDDQTRMRILHLAGTEIGHMHHMGFLHGDLNWRNILVQQKTNQERVFLVDLDGTRCCRHIDSKLTDRDLRHFYRDFERNHASIRFIDHFTDCWRQSFCKKEN